MREERGLFLNDSLYASKRSLPDRHRNYPQARLQDDFARRVNLQAPNESFPPFSFRQEKGVRCASGTQIAPTEPAGENARRGMSDKVED